MTGERFSDFVNQKWLDHLFVEVGKFSFENNNCSHKQPSAGGLESNRSEKFRKILFNTPTVESSVVNL